MVTINKQWIIKQLFYGTTATQFTYNTNNQIKSIVPVYGNKRAQTESGLHSNATRS